MWKRKGMLLAGLLLLVLAGLFGFMKLSSSAIPINRDVASEIRVGQTLGEVEMLVGAPPGDYRTRDIQTKWIVPTPPGRTEYVWQGNSGALVVWLDEDDRVAHKVFVTREQGQDSMFEHVSNWLRR
jgi:hypothetical protein